MADFNIITSSDRIEFEWLTSAPSNATASSDLLNIESDTRVDTSFFIDIDQNYTDYSSSLGTGYGLRITGSLFSGDTPIGNQYTFEHTGSSFLNLPVNLRYYNTGSAITDAKLKFLVNAPSVKSGSALTFELHDITVSYLGYSPTFTKLTIQTRKKLSDYYYFSFNEKLEVPNYGLPFNQSSELFEFGFITDHEIKFKNQDYDILSGQGVEIRKSNFALIEDFTTYSSSISLLPGNYEVISSSFHRDSLKSAESRFFADIQDSNYSSIAWTRGRYDGTEETNNSNLGEEPALTLKSFKGLIFPSSSEKAFLTQFFTSSNVDRVSSDIEDVYYYILGAGKINTGSAFFTSESLTQAKPVPQPVQYSYYQDMGNAALTTNTGSGVSVFTTFLLRKSDSSKTGFEKISNSKVVNLEKNWYYLTSISGSVSVKFSNVLP